VNSIILRTAVRILMPLLIIFSVFLLIRGHNQSGGGFAGGLVAAAAFALYSLSYDAQTARKLLGVQPGLMIATGLFLALFSGLIGLFSGRPFLTGLWGYVTVPGIGTLEVGTPVLFDIGVYLLVAGITLMMIFVMEEGG
jgi:multicomponent Na+:H+ antiporter subunit B